MADEDVAAFTPRATSCWRTPTTTTRRTPTSAGPTLTEFNWALDWFDVIAAGQRQPGAVDRRGGRLRAAAAPSPRCPHRSNQVAELAARAGRAPGRPGDPHARQPGRAVGDHPRRDEARRGPHPGHAAARARPTCATGSSAATPATSSSARPAPASSTTSPATTPGSRSASRSTAGSTTTTRTTRTAVRPGRRHPAPTTRCCSTSPPARPRGRSWSSTPTPRTRSGICPRCTGSACGPGDVHLNISSPGWAKHAWSNVFAPWNAGACVFIYNYTRFDAARAAAPDGPLRGHHLLRAADGVADADAVRPAALRDAAARGGRRRRAAQPRGHRAGPGRPGASRSATASGRPRRPSQVGQPARAAGQAGLDGPADARLRGRADRPGHRRESPARARSAST